ncbi:methionyl-tRNA formyltransferase [Pseudaquidulcibacter saccharophilus]|uniref:methionyl-tRNA formyltransferase n=1 Tax=Pseudaquidulcibacter saccharophilus TaxID=2831900 RepID=UPI001EFF41D7|nr:methionyl-tRNA formyltransferase [Pseudaquidulcibacter saccharophilus]
MKIAFLGSPDFAIPALKALIASEHEVVCVYSQPPRPKGRGQKLQPTLVHALAEENGIEVRTPKSLKSEEEQQKFRDLNLDIAIVVAYGLLLPKEILVAPKYGCLNIHPSLLPRWRGAAPLQRTIEAGDKVTSVQIMAMDEGLDTGAIYMRQDFEIPDTETYGSLSEKCSQIGAELVLKTLVEIPNGLQPIAQPEDGVTYAKKITKEEAQIDWSKPAHEIDCKIRGFSPLPAAWTMVDGVRFKILDSEVATGNGNAGEVLDDNLTIACGDGAIKIKRLQREGKPAQSATDFQKSQAINRGTRFD